MNMGGCAVDLLFWWFSDLLECGTGLRCFCLDYKSYSNDVRKMFLDPINFLNMSVHFFHSAVFEKKNPK